MKHSTFLPSNRHAAKGSDRTRPSTLSKGSAKRDDARFFMLNGITKSSQAVAMVQHLCDELRPALTPLPDKAKFIDALGAAVSALIQQAASNPHQFLYRPMAAKEFTRLPIGFRAFRPAIEGMVANEYVEKIEGFCPISPWDGPKRSSRFKATRKLIDLAGSYGITLSDWSGHFGKRPRPASISQPIRLKSSSRRVRGRKIDGKDMLVDYSLPAVEEAAAQVNEINAFMAKQDMSPDEHFGFCRIYSQGDVPDFHWNKGGRLYSLGGGYQNIKREFRPDIKINGEATVEVDLKASHLTVLHALMGKPLPPGPDPYAIPTLSRDVVKIWVTMTLGWHGFHTRWSLDAMERYDADNLKRLAIEYPLKPTRDKILKQLPILADWETNPIKWADLQYHESRVIIDAVHILAMEHNVPALPLHDSLIVPASKEELATQILRKSFNDKLKIVPNIETKNKSR